jgi:hypothetical protein
MAKTEIELPEEDRPTLEPFVYDPSNPHIKALIKLGHSPAKLEEIALLDAKAAEEAGIPVTTTADVLVEKRGRG